MIWDLSVSFWSFPKFTAHLIIQGFLQLWLCCLHQGTNTPKYPFFYFVPWTATCHYLDLLKSPIIHYCCICVIFGGMLHTSGGRTRCGLLLSSMCKKQNACHYFSLLSIHGWAVNEPAYLRKEGGGGGGRWLMGGRNVLLLSCWLKWNMWFSSSGQLLDTSLALSSRSL